VTGRTQEEESMDKLPTWLEINLDILARNIGCLRDLIGAERQILLTVKADAYGHGAVQVAESVDRLVNMFGVATLDEAFEIKRAGIRTPILVLSPVLSKEIPQVVATGVAVTLSSLPFAERLSECAAGQSKTVNFHIEIDTGMGRTGLFPEQAQELIAAAIGLPSINFAGLYTHFPVSDTDPSFTRRQVEQFLSFVSQLKADGIEVPLLHSANSGAIANVPESRLDMVRPGLLMYGYHPAESSTDIDVRPVMSWKTRLVQLRTIGPGWPVSYGRTFVTERETLMGIVPVGYGHGYPFQLSNRGEMIISGRRVPILGRVTMDMTMVDLTDLPEVPVVGAEVVLIGEQGETSIGLHELAVRAGTIPYEILCGISKRVPRTYLKHGQVETYKSLLGVLPHHLIT
jgi:alanine racemase